MEPGGWRVDAGSVLAAAVLESGDGVFVPTGVATVLSGSITSLFLFFF